MNLIFDENKTTRENVESNAKKIGLDALDFEQNYLLNKVGQKNPNPNGLPDSGVIAHGHVDVIGNEDKIWLYVGTSIFQGVRTSPLISFEKTDTGYKFETENSFYELNRQEVSNIDN